MSRQTAEHRTPDAFLGWPFTSDALEARKCARTAPRTAAARRAGTSLGFTPLCAHSCRTIRRSGSPPMPIAPNSGLVHDQGGFAVITALERLGNEQITRPLGFRWRPRKPAIWWVCARPRFCISFCDSIRRYVRLCPTTMFYYYTQPTVHTRKPDYLNVHRDRS